LPRQIRSSDKRSGCARSAAALGARLLAFTRARARVRIIRSGVGRTRAGPLGNTAITRVHSWGQWPDLGLDLERADYAVGAGAELRRPHRTRALVERTRRAPELFPPCHPLRRAASADEVGRAGGRVVRHFSARHVLPWRVPSVVLGLPPACRRSAAVPAFALIHPPVGASAVHRGPMGRPWIGQGCVPCAAASRRVSRPAAPVGGGPLGQRLRTSAGSRRSATSCTVRASVDTRSTPLGAWRDRPRWLWRADSLRA
jgi:hypothetical protein